MKVEFTIEETWQMVSNVVDQLLQLDLPEEDTARIRRWRSRDLTPKSGEMRMLAEKINAELQRAHDRSEVSAIKKPDWV